MTLLVVDASALVAALIDGGAAGAAVHDTVLGADLAAPELMPFETANVLRRLEQGRKLAADAAALAHADLVDLAVQLWPYRAMSQEAWRLRSSLTVYDASYVALARQLDVALVTLDQRLARAASGVCSVIVPS